MWYRASRRIVCTYHHPTRQAEISRGLTTREAPPSSYITQHAYTEIRASIRVGRAYIPRRHTTTKKHFTTPPYPTIPPTTTGLGFSCISFKTPSFTATTTQGIKKRASPTGPLPSFFTILVLNHSWTYIHSLRHHPYRGTVLFSTVLGFFFSFFCWGGE